MRQKIKDIIWITILIGIVGYANADPVPPTALALKLDRVQSPPVELPPPPLPPPPFEGGTTNGSPPPASPPSVFD